PERPALRRDPLPFPTRRSSDLGPLRLPVTEAKNARYALCRSLSDCTSTTLDTSPSQERSVVFFASVITWRCRSASLMYGSPAARDRKSTRLNSSHVKISYAVFG